MLHQYFVSSQYREAPSPSPCYVPSLYAIRCRGDPSPQLPVREVSADHVYSACLSFYLCVIISSKYDIWKKLFDQSLQNLIELSFRCRRCRFIVIAHYSGNG